MGKKAENILAESEHSESEEEDQPEEPKLSLQEDIVQNFGLKAINDEAQMLKRLDEVEKNFYNRLESSKLIKKQGRVPFTEHMTLSK